MISKCLAGWCWCFKQASARHLDTVLAATVRVVKKIFIFFLFFSDGVIVPLSLIRYTNLNCICAKQVERLKGPYVARWLLRQAVASG